MPIDSRNIPDLVHWYDGLLLGPHQFRDAARRADMLPPYLLHYAQPFFWGVRRLQAELTAERLSVFAVEAVLPDGLPVLIDPARGDAPLMLETARLDPQPQRGAPVEVWLTVAAWSDHAFDIDRADTGAPVRYLPHPHPPAPDVDRIDEDEELLAGSVWLRPHVQLTVVTPGSRPRGSFAGVPLARIGLGPEGSPVLLDFEPPRAAIADTVHILPLVRRLVADLRDRARQLDADIRGSAADQGRDGDGGQDADAPSGTERQLRRIASELRAMRTGTGNLQALVRGLPRLWGLLATGAPHPFELYLALCDVVGDVALVGRELEVGEVARYDHHDPLAAFQALDRQIRKALEALNQRYRIIPFERVTETRFQVQLGPDEIDATGAVLVIGAVRATSVPATQVQAWLDDASIGTVDDRRDLKQRRVSGWRRERIAAEPALGLRPPPSITLIRVTPDLQALQGEGVIVVENMREGGPVEMLLYLPRHDAGQAAASAQ